MNLARRDIAFLLAAGLLGQGQAPRNGRLRDCVFLPARDRLAFRVRGSWLINQQRVTTRGTNVPVGVFGRQYIIGTLTDAVPSATPPGPNEALLAVVDGPGRRYFGLNQRGPHMSWLTIPPPLDDAAALRRKQDYERGVLGIPRRSDLPGRVAAPPAEQLADLRQDARFDARLNAVMLTRARERVTRGRLRDGSVHHQLGAGRLANDTAVTQSRFEFSRDHPQPAFISSDAPRLDWRAVMALPPAEQDAAVAAALAELPTGLVVEDCHMFAHVTPPPGGTPRALLYYGTQHARRCVWDGVQVGTEYPGPRSTFEDVTVVNIGFGRDDHANASILQSVFPYCFRDPQGRWAGGYTVWRRCNFEQPLSFSPRFAGSNSTANLSFWGSNSGVRDQGHVFEQCRINGGAFCVDINPWPNSPYVGDIVFRQCAFGRDYSYEGNAGGLFNVRNIPRGGSWGNVRFEGCFWEDSGELIEELNGLWHPGPDGRPLRRPL